MSARRPPQRASLRLTLSLVISLLALLIVVGVSAVSIVARNADSELELRRKSILYAELLGGQLESAMAFGDRQTAQEVLESVGVDSDIVSAGLFREDGTILGGQGDDLMSPWVPFVDRPQLRRSGPWLEVLAPVVSREGPRGVLALRVSSARLVRMRHAAVLRAAAVGTVALFAALLAAWIIAGRLSRRLARIAVAASRVADGELDQPPLAPGVPDEIGRLTTSFNTMVAHLNRLMAQARDSAAHEQERLNALVAERTRELASRNEELERSRERYRLITETTNAIPWEFDLEKLRFTYVGPQAVALLGHPLAAWADPALFRSLIARPDLVRLDAQIAQAMKDHQSFESELRVTAADGRLLTLRAPITFSNAGALCLRGLLLDVTERKKLEGELAQAQKLESVGRLASGIAHEINTPVQFVGDSINFIRDAVNDTLALLDHYRQSSAGAPGALDRTGLEAAEEDLDLPYLRENLPKSIERSLEGLARVATLVRSMKDFAHPDQTEMSATDLNRAVESTLTIARNEYKYVAELTTELGDVGMVRCFAGELNQVILNLVVNAAHAIAGVVAKSGALGKIGVRTSREGDQAVIAISDTGGGIPVAIQARVFDPFFTTKEVGKGTGQGLAIARSVVVDKHGGSLSFETEPGVGTTFTLRVPIDGRGAAKRAA